MGKHKQWGVAAVLAGLACAGAGAPSWQAIPGAGELQIDLASVQMEHGRVQAWLRWWGGSALVPAPTAYGARAPRVNRTAVLTEFDCARRTLRPLASTAYASGGAAVAMSSVPGPARPVPEGDLAWAYDAVCEAARASGRL